MSSQRPQCVAIGRVSSTTAQGVFTLQTTDQTIHLLYVGYAHTAATSAILTAVHQVNLCLLARQLSARTTTAVSWPFHTHTRTWNMPFALTNQQHQSTDSNQGKLHTRLQPFLSNQTTCANLYHILRTLLPPPTAQKYSLRNRPHNRQLPDRISRITDCNFTVRMLYHNMY